MRGLGDRIWMGQVFARDPGGFWKKLPAAEAGFVRKIYEPPGRIFRTR